MQIGLIGSGNMARAMARGWGDPVLATDTGSGRAQKLVDELGGEVVGSNAELAERADIVMLCHKPAQLQAVADELGGRGKVIVSVLGGTSVAKLQAAYPDTPVFRFMPNTPVEVRRGIVLYSPAPGIDADLEREVLEHFGRLGSVLTMNEKHLEVATAVSGVGPAYAALIVEGWADAAHKAGLPAARAAEIAAETLGGAAELLRARGYDTLNVKREVASPGGSTAKGLAQLEAYRVRTALQAALDAVLDQEKS